MNCDKCGNDINRKDEYGDSIHEVDFEMYGSICLPCLRKYRCSEEGCRSLVSEEEMKLSADLQLYEGDDRIRYCGEDIDSYYYDILTQFGLSLCACVDGVLLEDLVKLLKNFNNPDFKHIEERAKDLGWDYKYTLALYVLLDDHFIDHGTSIRGSWIDDQGKEVCKKFAILDKYLEGKK